MLIAPETPYGIEVSRWERPRSSIKNGVPGMRPDGFEPYPARMYRITQKNPWKWEAETAATEVEQRNLESRGFVAGGLQAAVDAYEANQQALAVAAAARNYEDRNLSDGAKAERDAVEQTSSTHLGEIKETPIRRRRSAETGEVISGG